MMGGRLQEEGVYYLLGTRVSKDSAAAALS